MNYDCVIATRNRIPALRMSIPLMLAQDVLPERLIVVDSSDDHTSVKAEVTDICNVHNFGNLILVQADAPSSSRQRNIGLRHVVAPVVMFPDDDSMWFSGFASNVLSVYEADRDQAVGGVVGAATLQPPPELQQQIYKPGKAAIVKTALQPVRNFAEAYLAPKPFELIARSTWTKSIGVADDINVKRVETFGGFRMTFRTDLVKEMGFDETLGYGLGYCLYEDMDVALRIQRRGFAIVSAERAKVFHHVFPAKRANGFNYGFRQIVNYIYVCRKSAEGDRRIYSYLERYLLYRVAMYALRLSSQYGREAFFGAWAAWRNRAKLLDVELAQLQNAYMALCDEYIQRQR
jgi:glycosyltransferase involved in cell wall biosynthesis